MALWVEIMDGEGAAVDVTDFEAPSLDIILFAKELNGLKTNVLKKDL